MISFKHYGGYYTRYADRGMIDMNGLVVKVTYSDGTSENIAYKETVSGTSVTFLHRPFRGGVFFVSGGGAKAPRM